VVGDPEGTICDGYKVSWPLIGRSKRVTYLIGRDHRVRLAFHDEFKTGEHAVQACAAAPEAKA
jgi:peroxiredoxin